MDPLLVSARFAGFVVLMLLFGIAAQWAFAPRGPRKVLAALAGAGILLSAFGLLVLTAEMAGSGIQAIDPETLRMVMTETSVGWSFVVRLAALAVAFLLLGWPGQAGRVRRGAVALATGGAVATLAWAGHAVMLDGFAGWVQLVADIVHLLAAALWIGAIGWFLMALVTSADHARDALERFATTGTVLVAVLVATGAINGWMLLGDVPTGTILYEAYGRLLLVKMALFGAMLLVAARNRWRLVPALPGGRGALTRSLLLELALGVIVLAAVAWLGTLSPSG